MERFVAIKKDVSASDLRSWGLMNILISADKVLACSNKNAADCLAMAQKMENMSLETAVNRGILCA